MKKKNIQNDKMKKNQTKKGKNKKEASKGYLPRRLKKNCFSVKNVTKVIVQQLRPEKNQILSTRVKKKKKNLIPEP